MPRVLSISDDVKSCWCWGSHDALILVASETGVMILAVRDFVMAEGVNDSWAFVSETIVILIYLAMLCVPCQLFSL